MSLVGALLLPLEGVGVIHSDLVLPRFGAPKERQGQVGRSRAPTCGAGGRNGKSVLKEKFFPLYNMALGDEKVATPDCSPNIF